MDQASTLRVVVAVLVCCGLLPVNNVTSVPLPPCSLFVNHVDAAQPLSADVLRLYLACLGVERQRATTDAAVRQLLALRPSTVGVDDVEAAAGGGRSTADDVCGTVECLARRAALTFEPCSRLTQAQCSALVDVLEHIVISTNSDVDDDAAAARLLEHFRQFAAYRKRRQSHVTADRLRTKRHADVAGDEARSSDRETGNDKDDGMTSSRLSSGVGDLRMRRSTAPRGIPEEMTPETQAVIDSYLEWREKNGYGRVRGRWG